MIDPNTYILARVIHDQRIEEMQRRWRFFHRVATQQPSNDRGITEQIRYWLGRQFVKWGLELQGYPKVALPRIENRITANHS